jgi:uncharacterized protein (DUF1330 family)
VCGGVLGVEEYTMNARYTVGLTLLAGVALGSTATHMLRAQPKPMGYVIAENVVKDQDAYAKEFAPVIAKTIQDAGGKFLARGGKTVGIHGTPPAPRVVIIQFENLDKAQAWANSAAAKAAFAIGEKYSTLNDYAVEGISP